LRTTELELKEIKRTILKQEKSKEEVSNSENRETQALRDTLDNLKQECHSHSNKLSELDILKKQILSKTEAMVRSTNIAVDTKDKIDNRLIYLEALES